ncbi:DUF58 domain-containing protein [Thermoflavimicrobium dichotomicum]|uniref:Uncharacterized conserved protein, DUF58 family, contains vWF domain n=1 Tax=Thermoflavimicrobium dichotomicum TaxID=46223 RepID=A0A1I3RUP3_9BACL|nr:DUF58 domain-containing protein [Thermoflavimicrobium dichotomicum]SFJ50065.1 Uncharacterized conserved protein, DUF58 family, contains vWF domain [Thermoflavimicrobium dichotomicum]
MTFWKKLSRRFPFRGKAILPSDRLLVLLLLGVVVTALGSFWGYGWVSFSVFNGLTFALIVMDLFLLRQFPAITATRHMDSLFEIATDNTVTIKLTAFSPISVRMWLQDDYPHGFRVNQRTFDFKWNHEQTKEIVYQAQPHRRGRHRFGRIHIRFESKLRLLRVQQSFDQEMEVKVYPQLEAVRRVRRGLYRRQSFLEGGPTFRVFGAGREFSHIREYIPDDDPRNINWMATARRGKLVSNVYHPEAGQQVAILLDCGRLMGVRNEGKTRLDYAVEAVLGYAAIALQRGEQVSFLAFSNEILRFVPLGKGMEHLQRIIEASYDLEPGYAETDYLQAWDILSSQHKNKALVTIFTDAANMAFTENFQTFVYRARKKYQVMTVSMQDPRFIERLDQPLVKEEDVYQKMVIEQLLQERKEIFRRLNHKKVVTLDVAPDQLASGVIDSYLQIRSRVEA